MEAMQNVSLCRVGTDNVPTLRDSKLVVDRLNSTPAHNADTTCK